MTVAFDVRESLLLQMTVAENRFSPFEFYNDAPYPEHRAVEEDNAPGSKWAAVNAIIEYSDWIRPLRSNGQRFARVLEDGAEKTRALHLVAVA